MNLLSYQTRMFQDSERVRDLLERYTLENTISFGCVEKIKIVGK